MFENGQSYEQFLNEYYSLGPRAYLEYASLPKGSDLQKILLHTETNYYANQFAMGCQLWLSSYSEIYKILDKKPITSFGDSFKYTTAYNLDSTAHDTEGSTAIFGSPTEPGVSTVTGITSGIERIIMNRSLHDMIKEKIPGANGGTDWSWITKEIAPQALAYKIDKWLGGYETASHVHGVDTAAGANIECIDRMISNATESGADGNWVNTKTDGDIIWDGKGNGSAKFTRSDSTFEANVTLPATTDYVDGYTYNMMDEIDDLMILCKPYSKNKRYIGLTTNKTLNLIESELSPGQRYDETTQVQQTIGGINTRPGKVGGFDVTSIKTCGVTVPIFTSEALPVENSQITGDLTAGHFYLIDLDDLFIRVDMPATYLETGFGSEMLSVNYFQSRALLFTCAQLICTNPKSQGAIKWIHA